MVQLALQGYSGVALFMTLSGFLFVLICADKEIRTSGFYINRLLRIYPLFLAALLLACYLDPVQNNFWSLMSSVFFMHNLPGGVYYPQFTEVLWTIPIEMQFYLLFPLLLIFVRNYGLKYLFALLGLCIGIRLMIFIITGSAFQLGYTTIFGRLDQFIIGMLLGFAYRKVSSKFKHPFYLFASIILTGSVLMLFSHLGGLIGSRTNPIWIVWSTLEGIIWGAIIFFYNASSFSFPKRLSQLLALGGTLSFSMYVSHFLFLNLCNRWYIPLVYCEHHRYSLFVATSNFLKMHPIASTCCFAFCLELPITIAASILTYLIIEKPFLDLRSAYTKPNPQSISKQTSQSVAA